MYWAACWVLGKTLWGRWRGVVHTFSQLFLKLAIKKGGEMTNTNIKMQPVWNDSQLCGSVAVLQMSWEEKAIMSNGSVMWEHSTWEFFHMWDQRGNDIKLPTALHALVKPVIFAGVKRVLVRWIQCAFRISAGGLNQCGVSVIERGNASGGWLGHYRWTRKKSTFSL